MVGEKHSSSVWKHECTTGLHSLFLLCWALMDLMWWNFNLGWVTIKNILEKSVRSILRGFPHNPVQESCLNLSFSCKTVHSWCSLHFRKKQIKKCSFIFYSRMCSNGLKNRSQREAYVVHLWLCSSKTFLI